MGPAPRAVATGSGSHDVGCAERQPGLDLVSDQDVRAPNKSATDSIESAALSSPLYLIDSDDDWPVLKGLRAADRSCEAPPSLIRPSISNPASLLFDCPGNSVPPKEPPSLRCKAPPPKRLSTSIKEPDPINYPSAFLSLEA